MGVMSTVAHNSWIWIMAEYQEKTSWHWDLLGCGTISHGKWWKSRCLRSDWALAKVQILAWPQSFRADELIALTYAFPSTQTSDIPQYYPGRSNKGSCSTSYAILPHGCAPSACEYITPRGKKKKGWFWAPAKNCPKEWLCWLRGGLAWDLGLPAQPALLLGVSHLVLSLGLLQHCPKIPTALVSSWHEGVEGAVTVSPSSLFVAGQPRQDVEWSKSRHECLRVQGLSRWCW